MTEKLRSDVAVVGTVGIADSADLLAHDILQTSKGSVPPDIIRTNSKDHEWLSKKGVQYTTVRPFQSHNIPIPRLFTAGDNTFSTYIGAGYLWALTSGLIVC
jgi:hypothetical protein